MKRGRDKDRDKNQDAGARSRKAQVTMFVILGIIILVVIIFAISVASSFSKIKLKTESEKAVDAYLQSEAVSYYVYTCMDSAVTSSIKELALQGGVFYTYQNGIYNASLEGGTHIPYSITWEDLEHTQRTLDFNVSYSVVNRSYCALVSPDAPAYPYDRTSISSLYGLYNSYSSNGDCLYNLREGYALSGFAGLNNMTRLCYFGSNNTKAIGNVEFSPCSLSLTTNENWSVEKMLENQISIRMKNCTDFSVFVDDNITVLGDPVTKIIYTSDSMMVRTTYNLSVKIKNKEPIIVKHSFEYKSDLRFVRLYNYVMAVLKAESQDFFFNFYNNYDTYSFHNELNPDKFFDREHMNVRIINFTECETCSYRYDHLLIVEDNKSIIENKSLTYITAIKNRMPALDFVHVTPPSAYYDVIVSNNQEITLAPMGYDPDEGEVSYDYEGWKEDWNEICMVREGAEGTVEIICQKDTSVIPKNWTLSTLFNQTFRSANYKTSADDMGAHNVTIAITDKSGLQDFQIVRILVFDLPEAVLSPIKVYPDMPDGVASIEDRLLLDGSESINSAIGGGTITAYIWQIYWENPSTNVLEEIFNRVINGDAANPPLKTLVLPLESADMSVNQLIQEIVPLELSRLGTHNVTLTVQSPIAQYGMIADSLPDSQEITVYECLPHENSENPYPFPYHNVGSDPFDATHACCGEEYNILGTETTCYSTERYGEYDALQYFNANDLSRNDEFTSYNPSSYIAQNYVNNLDENDIYQMTFERACDDNRGNLCAGPMTKSITHSLECEDSRVGEEETCSGPAPSITSEPQTDCYNYAPGDSFENRFGTGTGICNTQEICSRLGAGGYGAIGGTMRCTATCNGGTCINTRATDCRCEVGFCNAVCDDASDFLRQNNICRHSCGSTSSALACTFSSRGNLPCAVSSYCRNSSSTYNFYCYYNVACTGTGPEFTRGQYCRAGYTDPEMPDICVYSSNPAMVYTDETACGSTGNCLLTRAVRPPSPQCPQGEQYRCTTTGWSCSAT